MRADRQTNIHTDTLIATVRDSTGEEVKPTRSLRRLDFDFYPRDAMLAEYMLWLVSVRLSDTSHCSINTAECITTQSTPNDSRGTLVF